ncbi:unnamed protein product [Sphagnum balticum]
MGDAFSAVVDDASAVFYNPAALDKIRGFHVTLVGLDGGADTTNFYSIYQNLTGRRRLCLTQPAYPSLSVNAAEDYGASAGGAFGLFPGDTVRLGFAAKRITRYGGSIDLGAASLASLSNSQINNLLNNYGTGYGFDAGALFEIPTSGTPTFSLVWHDIGQTAFTMQGGSTPLQPIDNNAVAGFSMLFAGGGFGVRPAIDITHLNLANEDIGKKIQAGIEITMPLLSLRGGFNQGYYTAGAGVDFKYLRIDAATYGEELDTYPGATRRPALCFAIHL